MIEWNEITRAVIILLYKLHSTWHVIYNVCDLLSEEIMFPYHDITFDSRLLFFRVSFNKNKIDLCGNRFDIKGQEMCHNVLK